MGAFVVLILIAVPFSIWAIVSPKGMWWATTAWKFRDPDANEPSDSSYTLTRISGIVAIVALAVMGGIALAAQRDNNERADQQAAAESSRKNPPKFDAPPAEDLGPLPVIGYRLMANGQIGILHFAPPVLQYRHCDPAASADGLGTALVTVHVHGRFAPQKAGDKIADCKVDRYMIHGKYVVATDFAYVGTAIEGQVVMTDSPIGTKDGTIVAPAGNNVVPLLP